MNIVELSQNEVFAVNGGYNTKKILAYLGGYFGTLISFHIAAARIVAGIVPITASPKKGQKAQSVAGVSYVTTLCWGTAIYLCALAGNLVGGYIGYRING